MISRPRAGIDRIARPARPAAATSVVASTATDPVTSDAPAVALGATNGVQLSVPRSTSVSDIHWVVTPDDSMKSRNGGLIRPSSSSGTIHHATASAGTATHHAVNRHHRRFGRWHAHQITAARHAVSVATALTAPISATASADRAASSRSRARCPRSARITGSSTHGASIIGSVSDEIEPSVVSTRGDSANATAAMTRDVRRADAERLGDADDAPEPDDEQQRPPQPLGDPAGQAEQVAGEKNAPCGKK